MTLFEQFVRNFGKWSVESSCDVGDLPFIDDIKRFLNEAGGEVSDGYHTFNELYEHRHALFINVVLAHADKAFKTRKNHKGETFEGWFILGFDSAYGQLTYHLPDSYWDCAVVKEVESNSTYDGHTVDDVLKRLLLLSEVSKL